MLLVGTIGKTQQFENFMLNLLPLVQLDTLLPDGLIDTIVDVEPGRTNQPDKNVQHYRNSAQTVFPEHLGMMRIFRRDHDVL